MKWSATKDDAVRIMKEANILRLDSTFPAVYGLALTGVRRVTTPTSVTEAET